MAAELKAQRVQLERTHRLEAWAEMARQVAHEIKNPLTPIQLSAEHLRRVHADRGEPMGAVLDHCVSSILTQVRLLRQISSEFSSFSANRTDHESPGVLGASQGHGKSSREPDAVLAKDSVSRLLRVASGTRSLIQIAG